MKRIGLLVNVMAFACTLMIFCTSPTIFACSGCNNDKEIKANEQSEISCFICGKNIKTHGTPLEIEQRGVIFCFCSKACADTFNRNPEKCIREKILQQK